MSNFLVLHTQAGEDCDRSKESSEYLEILIQQAAVLQNTIDHTQSHTPDISASALKVCMHLFISNKCLLWVFFFFILFVIISPLSFRNRAFLQSFTSSAKHAESFPSKPGEH